jgi:hypothetical protein
MLARTGGGAVPWEELKRRRSAMWGAGPPKWLPSHGEPAFEHVAGALGARSDERVLVGDAEALPYEDATFDRTNGGVHQPRPSLLVRGKRRP